MNALVSICIPTCQRPDLLREAIDSCLRQTYSEIEVIVGDDSGDDASRMMVERMGRPDLIRYQKNAPPLRQAGNVNSLFDRARGSRLMLLHDDDLLLDDAVESLLKCWELEPDLTAAYGKQYMIDMKGRVLEKESEALNASYHRTPARSGRQASALRAGMMQFPNDGYMVLAEAARRVRYRDEPSIGAACDLDFGMRLGAAYDGFHLLDRYTAKYRCTETSISMTNSYAHLSYRLIESVELPRELEELRAERLRSLASPAVNACLATGDRRGALRIYASRHYPLLERLSRVGMAQACLMAFPSRLSGALLREWRRWRQRPRPA